MIDRTTLGQTIAGQAAHVLYPLCYRRQLHALINRRSPIDSAGRGHAAERINGHHIRRSSRTCRNTDNDDGLSKCYEESKNRSSAPLLRTFDQTAVAFVPLSPRDEIRTPDGVFFRTQVLRARKFSSHRSTSRI